MNGDDAVKTGYIGMKATDGEKQRAQWLADALSGGNQSNMIRQLLSALEEAYNQHGDRIIWPPQLNYYPEGTPNAQDRIKPKDPE